MASFDPITGDPRFDQRPTPKSFKNIVDIASGIHLNFIAHSNMEKQMATGILLLVEGLEEIEANPHAITCVENDTCTCAKGKARAIIDEVRKIEA